MFKHATTDIIFLITKNAHILQPTLSMSHSQGGGGGGWGWGGRGSKVAYSLFALDLRTRRTKTLYTPKITEYFLYPKTKHHLLVINSYVHVYHLDCLSYYRTE